MMCYDDCPFQGACRAELESGRVGTTGDGFPVGATSNPAEPFCTMLYWSFDETLEPFKGIEGG